LSLPLLAELQRRRVFRALIGYGIAAFAVLQIVEPVMHGLHWPESVLGYVVLGLAVGFPVVVALAWIFDVNAGRIERTVSVTPLAGSKRAGLALLLATIGVLAAAPGVVWYFWRERPRAQARQTASIAVLPFLNLSGNKDDEYFSDGMTEEIINALANVEGLRVVARTSAFSFKGKNVNVRTIAEELNVATVLEGSVRRDGNQIRISAQLINAADGYHVWSKSFDRELKNVFALEDELARAIADALRPRLVRDTALVQPPTTSTEAHDLYLKGRHLWARRTPQALRSAMEMFEQAIALDPKYALAQSGLSDCYSLLLDYGGASAADVLPNAKLHALRAQELDDTLAEVHASLGTVREHDYDWAGAEREFKRAIELRPGYATAHQWYGIHLHSVGRMREAREQIERARQLDPSSSIMNTLVQIDLFMTREFDKSIEQGHKVLQHAPSWELARSFLAYAYLQTGRTAPALQVVDAAPSRVNSLQVVRAHVLAASGDRGVAKRMLIDAEGRFAAEPVPRGYLAAAHLALGDTDRAFAWLAKAVEERDQSINAIKTNPLWDAIRSDPRFVALLKRMNLE
jgi:serine/threonine-protein kinase